MKSRCFMKRFRKFSLSLLLIGAMLLCLAQTSFADGISISAGQGSVSVGKTVAFSITVPSGSEAWTYSVSWSGNCHAAVCSRSQLVSSSSATALLKRRGSRSRRPLSGIM